jgi:hypothetical protein
MFQKDYWRMPEKELTKLAEANNIPPTSLYKDDPDSDFYFDRDRVINALLVRDNALRTKWTIALSVLALLVSITSLVISILRK